MFILRLGGTIRKLNIELEEVGFETIGDIEKKQVVIARRDNNEKENVEIQETSNIIRLDVRISRNDSAIAEIQDEIDRLDNTRPGN